jgi:hypothetical protein
MTVRVYRSTDSGAPSIGRSLGSIITLLDAVLVNGYGSKSPLGWSKQYSGTNAAMYLQGTGSSGCTLYVSHNTYADYADVVCGLYQPTSITDTAKNKFNASYAINIYAPEAKWVVVGNEKAFYLFTSWGNWGSFWSGFFFGDIVSYSGSSDVGRCMITGYYGGADYLASGGTAGHTSQTPYAMAGPPGGISPTFNVSPQTYAMMNAATNTFPQPVSKDILALPRVISCNNDIRGEMPGCYMPSVPLVNYAYPTGSISGSGPSTGKTFEFFPMYYAQTTGVLIETSDTWTN